jgi:hypothetical protein
MKYGPQTFSLPHFNELLYKTVSTGDFLDEMFNEYPDDYKRIWEILDSSRKYTATYYTGLFDAHLKVLKTVRDVMTGDIISWSEGGFKLKLAYNRRVHDVKKVLFRQKMNTVAEIDFPCGFMKLFNSHPILRIGDKEYPLPDYIRVLSGFTTEEKFIQELYLRYSDSDVEKIWKVLTDNTLLHRSIY